MLAGYSSSPLNHRAAQLKSQRPEAGQSCRLSRSDCRYCRSETAAHTGGIRAVADQLRRDTQDTALLPHDETSALRSTPLVCTAGQSSVAQNKPNMYGRHPTPATLNRERACLKHRFNVARQGLLHLPGRLPSANLVSAIRFLDERNIRDGALTSDEFQRMVDLSPGYLKPVWCARTTRG